MAGTNATAIPLDWKFVSAMFPMKTKEQEILLLTKMQGLPLFR